MGICLTMSLVVCGAKIKPTVINAEDGTLIKGKAKNPVNPTKPVATCFTTFPALDNKDG